MLGLKALSFSPAFILTALDWVLDPQSSRLHWCLVSPRDLHVEICMFSASPELGFYVLLCWVFWGFCLFFLFFLRVLESELRLVEHLIVSSTPLFWVFVLLSVVRADPLKKCFLSWRCASIRVFHHLTSLCIP